MLSFSDTNMMDAGDRAGLVDDIEAFINDRFDGHVTRPLVDRPHDGEAVRATDDGTAEPDAP